MLLQVSEWRHGEVGEADLGGMVVIKPLAGQGGQPLPSAEANSYAEEDEEDEEGAVCQCCMCLCYAMCTSGVMQVTPTSNKQHPVHGGC